MGGQGVQSWTDPLGRVHVTVTTDRAIQDVAVSRNYDAARQGAFIELVRQELQGVTRGQIVLGANISPPAGFTGDTLVLEVNLVGYIGALPTIVDRGSLSQTSPSRRFRFDDVENYTAVGVEARQVVDGVPNSTVIPAAFNFQLFGLFWS